MAIDDLVEDLKVAFDEIDMAVGDGIEGSGIDRYVVCRHL